MKAMNTCLMLLITGLMFVAAGPAFANEDAEYTCEEAAQRVSDIIEDWYLFIREMGAESKNPSVIAMHADYEKGTLADKFTRQCLTDWSDHEEVYVCLSGTRSEIGAAMCKHPDTNKNDWQYQ